MFLNKVLSSSRSIHSVPDILSPPEISKITLKKKVEELEREKRDLLTVVSRLEDDATQREVEINDLRGNLKNARKEAQELESSLRDIRATERSTAVSY